MNLLFFCPHWGSEHLPFEVFLSNVKSAGYNGVEMSLPLEDGKRNGVVTAIEKAGLLFIAQHWETVDSDLEMHLAGYETRLRNLASAHPLFINSQTGKDYFSFAGNKRLIELADAVAAQTGIRIVHETHRGKFSFAAHVTRLFLEAIPHLQLTLDASHWCNVAETLLHDQQEALQLAIERTHHIHARVGYPEGPQVPDPADPLWNEALQTHLGWWQRVADAKRIKGDRQLTITPEFGAPPYTVLLPGSHQPISSQWENNIFMMKYLKQHLQVHGDL